MSAPESIKELKATFWGWKIGFHTQPAEFTVILRCEPIYREHRTRYRIQARVIPTMQKMGDSFAESKLREAKEWVERQFERKVSDWA